MHEKRRLQTTDLASSLSPAPVYINEHLTPNNRKLLGYVKSAVKDGRLLATWSRDGRITVRKCENAAATRVWCPRDVDRIMGDVSQDMDCTRTEK
ncbi:hypothetical protein J6590_035239 [Homalodisca vitripennis]|nr:hypothetical protein J6590_035239 [Homalodisca vitripennis]